MQHHRFLLVVLTLLMAACGHYSYPTAKPVPSLRFDHLQPYTFNGGSIAIVSSFQKHSEAQLLEREVGYSPQDILIRYLSNRFVMSSARQTMEIDIIEASLEKNTLETDALEFMTGLSKDRYKMILNVAFYPLDNLGERMEPYTLKLTQKLEISENVSLADREYRLFEWMEEAITKLDKGITQIVGTH